MTEFLRIHGAQQPENNNNNNNNNGRDEEDDENDFPYNETSEKKRRCAMCIEGGARTKTLCPLASQCQQCGSAVCSCHRVTICKNCLRRLIGERIEDV